MNDTEILELLRKLSDSDKAQYLAYLHELEGLQQ